MRKIYLALVFVVFSVVNQYAQTTTFDFESGNIDDWGLLNPAQGIDITQEDKHGGEYALKMANGTSTNAWSVQSRSPVITIVTSHIYKVSFWVRTEGGGGKGRISTAAGNQLGGQYWADFTVDDTWTQITYNDLTASGSSVQLTFDMGYIADKIYYIDDIVIEDITVVNPSDGPLAKDHDKFLGNIVASTVPASFNNYWNQITPENSGKWSSIQSSRNSWNWNALNRAYSHAKNNGYPFKFHTFVWGSQEPNWIKSTAATPLSDAERLVALENLMDTVAKRYPDIDFIDVVNEPFHETPSTKAALGGNGTTGYDWIVKAFEMARKYFPNAKLHINEYGIINNPSTARDYVRIINILKARDLIDGIGIQCHHFNMDPASVSTIKSVLDILAATGLPIYVSELDMNGGNGNSNNAGTEEGQYENYKNKFPVLWEHEGVAGITLWGYIYGSTWRQGTGLIESNGTERKAMIWLKEYMASEESKVPNKFKTGIKNTLQGNEYAVYPNPATDYISIIGENITRVDLFDISGKHIMTSTTVDNINVSQLERGLYLLRVEANGKTIPLKMMKK